MKRIAIVILLSLSLSLICADINETAPEFMQPFFDCYSNNYVNAIATGRGNTGVASYGNIESALINPASFNTNKTSMYLELMYKPAVDEISHNENKRYYNSGSLSYFGFGYNIIKDKLSMGIYYSNPVSMKYDSYRINFKTANYVKRDPGFSQYRVGLVNTYQWHNLAIGIDLRYDINSVDDGYVMGYSSKNDQTRKSFNFATGMIYNVTSRFDIGVSYTNSYEQKFDYTMKEWNVTQPARLITGVSYDITNSFSGNLDIEHRFYSQIDDELKDTNIIKCGFEKKLSLNTFRFGGIYIPSLYSGKIKYTSQSVYHLAGANIPEEYNGEYPTHDDDYFYWTYYDEIKDNDQLLLTCGYSINYKDINVNLAFLQGVASKMNVTQVYVSLGINLTDFDIMDYIPGRELQ